MFKKLLFGLFSIVFCASLCIAADLPAYQEQVVDQTPGLKHSIDCILAEPVDAATLRAWGEGL